MIDKRIVIIALCWNLLSSCSDNPNQNDQSGITIVDNTIAVDTGRVQITYFSPQVNALTFQSTVQSAARSSTPFTLQNTIPSQIQGAAWDFSQAQPSQISSFGSKLSLLSQGGAWANLLSGSLYFDSTTRVRIPHNSLFDADSFAVIVHLFPTDTLPYNRPLSLVQKGTFDIPAPTSNWALVLLNDGRLYAHLKSEENPIAWGLFSKISIQRNQWSKVEMRRGSQSLSLWINDQKVADTTWPAPETIRNTRDIRIGCDSNATSSGGFPVNDGKEVSTFRGLMDFVAIRTYR